MKYKLLNIIISVFLAMSIFTVSVFASSSSSNKDENSNPTGFNSWSWQEKLAYMALHDASILGSVLHIATGDTKGFKELMEDCYFDNVLSQQYSSYSEMLAAKMNYDDNTQTWSYDDDLKDFFNKVLDTMKEDGYQYGYFCHR